MKSKFAKISDFSKLTGLSIKALRLYETHGILVPNRSDSNRYRLYSESQVELAKEISDLRATGFSIREIKALLPFRSQAEGGLLILLRQQLKKTDQNINSLKQQRNKIKQLIKQVKLGVNSADTSNLFAKRLVCKEISDSIKLLNNKQLLEKIKKIPNSEYIRTLTMVDDIAKEKLLSVISEKAKRQVKSDLLSFGKKYSRLWTPL